MTGWRRQDGDDRVGDLFCEASSIRILVSTPGLATRPDWPLRRAPPQASRIAKIWWGDLGGAFAQVANRAVWPNQG
jgi:hypothetical protein